MACLAWCKSESERDRVRHKICQNYKAETIWQSYPHHRSLIHQFQMSQASLAPTAVSRLVGHTFRFSTVLASLDRHRAIALWRKPLRKLELRILPKMITFAPIFSIQNYFSFTFNLYLGMSWIQISAAVKLPKNQLRFKQAVKRIWIKLRGPVL